MSAEPAGWSVESCSPSAATHITIIEPPSGWSQLDLRELWRFEFSTALAQCLQRHSSESQPSPQ